MKVGKARTSLVAVAAALAMMVATAQADAATITLVDTDSAYTATNSGPGDFTLTAQGGGNRDGIYSYSYNAGSAFDMLVVSVSREASSAGQNEGDFPDGLGDAFEVAYDGVDMNLATGTTDGSSATIFYLATTATSGVIALDFRDFSTVNGIGIGIAALKSDNGDPIALFDANSGNGTSISINTADDSFTLWAVDTNGSTFGNLTPNQIVKVTDIGSNGYAAAYELVTTGQVGDTYSYTNTNSPRGIAAANFVVVPEPASLAMGLFGLTLIAGRRRR